MRYLIRTDVRYSCILQLYALWSLGRAGSGVMLIADRTQRSPKRKGAGAEVLRELAARLPAGSDLHLEILVSLGAAFW